MKYLYPVTRIEAVKLPSTSPANAAFSIDRLEREWRIIKDI
jgi:G:T/U-mismatch repair DNA glycosylase